MKELNQQELDQLIQESTKPVLVDFFATWCGPCKAMAPILESVEKSADGQVADFVKVDVDKEPELSAKYGVMAVPTIVLIKDGNIVYKQAGVHQPQQLATILKEHC